MSVENRPEAPWIRRTQGGVVFTENYLDREEREIENLSEVIIANNLKGDLLFKCCILLIAIRGRYI